MRMRENLCIKKLLSKTNSSGFTLIEVLGVLVVLSIVSIITVPAIYKAVEGSKKNAFKETAEEIVKSASVYYADNEKTLYRFFEKHDGILTFLFDETTGKEGMTTDGQKLKINGKVPIAGSLLLYENGDIVVKDLTDGKYFANKEIDAPVIVTTNSVILSREELSKAVRKLQEEMKEVQAVNKTQDAEITAIKNENTTLKAQVNTNKTGIATNKTDIANLKKQVEENTTNISNFSKNQLNKTYPIGSIYISTNSTSPATLFGGTWEVYGSGRTLVGMDANDSNFNTIGKTGGASTINLAHSHTVNNHTHTINAHSHTVNSHTHTIPSHSHTVNSHTHTINSHSHTVNAHQHVQTMGADDNNIYLMGGTGAWGSSVINTWRTAYKPSPWYAEGLGRLHYTQASSPGTNAVSLTTNGSAPGTSAVSLTTNGSAPGTNAVALTTNGSTPGTNSALSASQSILQPYVTVYMWRRTA